jgi:hypothetical protein
MSRTLYILLLSAILAVAILIGCKSSDDDNTQVVDDQVLVTITPADNVVNVPTQSVITVNFDHAMMVMEHMDEMFMLHQGWGIGMAPIAVIYSWSNDNTVLTMQTRCSTAREHDLHRSRHGNDDGHGRHDVSYDDGHHGDGRNG